MSPTPEEEPLLPPWVIGVAVRFGPVVVLVGLYLLLNSVFSVPGRILFPLMAVLALAALIYFGGRYYKPFRAEKKTGKCVAHGPDERKSCRNYMPGAKLGGGCGRIMENGCCRVLRG